MTIPKSELRKITKKYIGKPLPEVEAIGSDATAVKPIVKQKKQVGNYKKVDSTISDAIKNVVLPGWLPDNAKQLAAKLMGDARMSNNSLSDDQKVLLWDVIQNAKKRSGKADGGTEYEDYGGLGYGSPEDFNKWWNRGGVNTSNLLKSFTNPAYELSSTIGRGRYWTDPEDPNKMYYTDVYDWNPSEKNFPGSNLYQIARNALRNNEDKNLNKEKNENYRMNFELNAEDIEKMREKRNRPSDYNLDRNGGWLEKYQVGGPVQPNYNDYSVSAGPGFEGDGYSNVGRNYSPAWGGQFKNGGSLSIPTIKDKGSFNSDGIWIPDWKAMAAEAKKLGAKKVKTDRGGVIYFNDKWEAVSADDSDNMAMGGSIGGATQGIPGATGFMYARTGSIPSNGKYAKKTKASAQQGAKIEEELTKPEPTELELEKAKEIPYVPSPEPEYIAPVEPPETKSEPYVSTTPTSRERERKLNLVELYSNPESDYDVQEYMNSFFAANKNKIDAKTVSLAKRDISQYINSPEYAQRQANFPEQYIGGSADSYVKKKFEAAIAKGKREERLKNLNTVPVTLTDDKHSNFFVPDENRISLNKNNIPSVLYHELTHASSRDIDFEPIDPRQLKMDQMFGVGRTFPDSDRVNTRYWDSIVSKTGKKPVSAGLNISEQNKFVELAKPADYRPNDIHFSNTTDAQEFSSEQYGDLMGVRSLLYKSGITKSFGEKLDKGKLDKALNNSKVKADPVFKRFFFRYGPENVIQLNNTIAANNPQQGMPMAQNGEVIPGEFEPIQNDPEEEFLFMGKKYEEPDRSKEFPFLVPALPAEELNPISININQKNLGLTQHTFTHQPGMHYDKNLEGTASDSYMLKRTANSFPTDEDVRLNVQMPTSPKDIDFISNYKGAIGQVDQYPTSVPFEGEKHWNIDRFIIDPHFGSGNPNLENDATDKTQQRRNVLADMYKYYLLQNKGDKDVAWKQANEFMTNEIDPRISGPMYDKLRGNVSYSGSGSGITSVVDDNYVRNFNELKNAANIPDSERSEVEREFLKNPTSDKQAKDLAMDWLINYKKMSPKDAEAYYKKLPKKQNGGEMKFYQEGLDFKPKTISKNGSVIKDDRGQWAHPGEITEIDSNQITMQGVPYPVLGISDTGDMQMMYPDQEYEFIGDSVTEYPMMQKGGNVAYVDSVLNANKNLNWVKRLYDVNRKSIMLPGQKDPSTHFMESGDGRVYPTVVEMPDGKLKHLGDKAFDYADSTNTFIEFPTDSIATWFGKNYKKGTGVLKKKKQGGQLTKLDQLSNFTNYNTKQPGSWLDKYQ